MKNFALLILIIVVLLLSALSVNQEEIVLRFAIWETPFQISVYWWLLAAFGLGVFTGLTNTFFINVRLRLENRRIKKSLKDLSDSNE